MILYLHIGGAKYSINSIKKDNSTKITIQKMVERIESNIIL